MTHKVLELSEYRQALLATEGSIIVLGGPGSGKTTIALLKADREISDGKIQPSQQILFLSFARATIARVAQQAGKLLGGKHSDRLETNTYHGFAWNLLRSHGYLLRAGRDIQLLPPPEAAARLAEVNGEPARHAEKRRLFAEDGLLHFDLFAEMSSSLLTRSRSLCKTICDAYPLIILDEFQDTNKAEWELIQALGEHSRLIALADAEQRIYEFRGADPKRIGEFIGRYKPATFDFGTENHRSNGTDIAVFGNDLLTGANKNKVYSDVKITKYGYYAGRNQLFPLKAAVLAAMQRQIETENDNWSVAVLVPTKKMMLQVSDYLSQDSDNLPLIHHDVALDTEAPSLAAMLIASFLEGGVTPGEISQRLLADLCTHIRGRKGNGQPTQAELGLVSALGDFIDSGAIRGTRRKRIVEVAKILGEQRYELELTGDPGEDWLSVRGILEACGVPEYIQVAEDARFLRLLHKGALLRSRLSELWRKAGTYMGAASAVRDALVQEHFSASVKEWRGIHVMTIHKSKGKEFDEVLIYEGTHNGKIIWAGADDLKTAQALLTLRVGVTRAMRRASVLTPLAEPCPFL